MRPKILGYRGEYTDYETGYVYLRNRYYDPSNGRFITEDPIRDGTNWYVYCSNNPVNFIDPWGLASFREKWDALWDVGVFDAYNIYKIGEETLKNAQNYAIRKNLKSVTDNEADAYRHFSWNYDAVKEGIPFEDVMQATTNHEVLTQVEIGQDAKGITYYKVALSSLMDLHNNNVGRYQATLKENKNKNADEVFNKMLKNDALITSLNEVMDLYGIKDSWLYPPSEGARGEVSVLIKNGLRADSLSIIAVNKDLIRFKK